jgi:hypothetical protein
VSFIASSTFVHFLPKPYSWLTVDFSWILQWIFRWENGRIRTKWPQNLQKIPSKSTVDYVGDRNSCNSNTVTNYIAFPWLSTIRDVPKGISSGTWGQKDPAGSRLASDSVRRRRKRETLVPKKLSGKDDLMGSTPMWRPGGWDGQTTEPQLV